MKEGEERISLLPYAQDSDGISKEDVPNHHRGDEENVLADQHLAHSYPTSESQSPQPRLIRKIASALGLVCRRFLLRKGNPSHSGSLKAIDVGRLARLLFNYPESTPTLRETAWLDGLRGLAAFEVVIYHYILDPWYAKWGDLHLLPWADLPFIRTLWNSGSCSVNLFFSISGYVLSYRMWTLIHSQDLSDGKLLRSLSSAIFRRGIRLYLPIFLTSFIFMFLVRCGYPRPDTMGDPALTFVGEIPRWMWGCIGQLVPVGFPADWDKMHNPYDRYISWTIPYEYYGSVQVYVAVLFLSHVPRLSVRLSFVGAWVFFSLLRDDWVSAQFLCGMAFADYQVHLTATTTTTTSNPQSSPSHRNVNKTLLWLTFLFGFYLAGLPYYSVDSNSQLRPRPYFDWIPVPSSWYATHITTDRILWGIAGMCILISCSHLSPLQRFLRSGFIQHLGRISFGLYLCHKIVQMALNPLADFLCAWMQSSLDQPQKIPLAAVLWYIPAIPINLVVAGQFQRWIDEPSVRLGRTLEKWCTTLAN